MHARGISKTIALAILLSLGLCQPLYAQQNSADAAQPLNLRELFSAGGTVGVLILFLSFAMVALIVEHLITIRRNALMPPGLADEVHELIARKEIKQAEQQCKLRPSYLSSVLEAGLAEVGLGYSDIEKAMEDASTEQSARLFRKIEYLSLIHTLAPMLGLLGTVWGMMNAFHEFELQATPQPQDLAPGIYKALITTLMGLGVAVPAMASFAYFRNRIDELVADASLEALRVFADFKRSLVVKRKVPRANRGEDATESRKPERRVQSVAIERETN